jgi:hypothetical protein
MANNTYYDNLCDKYPAPPFPMRQQPVPGTYAAMHALTNEGFADAYVFLTADEASYRSGSTIPVTELE